MLDSIDKIGICVWDLGRYALSALRYALLGKVVPPDFLNPFN